MCAVIAVVTRIRVVLVRATTKAVADVVGANIAVVT
jgi:hypothetical protein